MTKAAELKRLHPRVTLLEAAGRIADGHPGAAEAVAALLRAGAAGVDPGQPFGAHGPLFALDELELYGARAWALYAGACGRDAVKFTALLRGWRLGVVSEEQLVAAAHGWRTPLGAAPLDASRVLEQVRARLPRFGRGRAVLLSERNATMTEEER